MPVPRFDILGLGAVAVDDLIYVDSYPAADEKCYVRRMERQCGGLTATALVAASRLGAKCAYAGALGDDDLSRFCLERMAAEGIDLVEVCRQPEARPFHSFIVVAADTATRNIFADSSGVVGAAPEWPPAEVIRSARVVFVDHVGVAGALRAARLAREAGIPVVADFERRSGPEIDALIELVDHLVVSRAFATELTGTDAPDEATRRLWNERRETVVITGGSQGAWFLDRTKPGVVQHQKAFPVEVVDSTGCGDVFHGAYAASLAKGGPPDLRILRASGAAALKAQKRGGQAGAPTLVEVAAALKEWGH